MIEDRKDSTADDRPGKSSSTTRVPPISQAPQVLLDAHQGLLRLLAQRIADTWISRQPSKVVAEDAIRPASDKAGVEQ